MPKLQILLDKGEVTFNNNNKRKRFRLLNFPHTAILDIMRLYCLYCWKADRGSFVWNNRTTLWRHEIQDGGAQEI